MMADKNKKCSAEDLKVEVSIFVFEMLYDFAYL